MSQMLILTLSICRDILVAFLCHEKARGITAQFHTEQHVSANAAEVGCTEQHMSVIFLDRKGYACGLDIVYVSCL